jgi:hypothetical protein
MIEISVTGKNMEDCAEQIGHMLKEFLSTDDLVGELRRRMALQGLEVTIARDGAETSAPAVEKRGPGRPRKIVAEPAEKIPEKTAETEKVEVESEEPKTNGKNPVVTRDMVIEALDTYAKTHGGQPAGREVMKKIAGVTRLIDCAAEHYPKLLAALQA